MKIREGIKDKQLKIIAIVFLTAIIGRIVSLTLKESYAYYGNSNELKIMEATIGDFSKVEETEMLKGNYDISVILYMKEQDYNNIYRIVQNIPIVGYKVNEKKSNCTPSSATYDTNNYKINDKGEITLKVKENNPNKVVCQIYYVKDGNSDIVTYALVEDEKGTMTYNSKKYKVVNSIPESGYIYKESRCANENIQTQVIYDEELKEFKFKTNGANVCYAYFDKN